MNQTLPILERRAEIEHAIAGHQVTIVCGQTGSGKTTQLPQICMAMGLAKGGLIGHTQPRRLAARAVATRISEELGEGGELGGAGRVGVKVRFTDQTGRNTAIKVMTDGMLLAELASDPLLRAYRTLIIDEAHERSLNVDFLLGVLRGLLPRRPELKLIITSATIDPKRFSDAFGGPSVAPVIEVSGRMYPVEIRYHPGRDARDGDSTEVEPDAVGDAVEELGRASMPPGDVLVFLPGEREIRAVDNHLRSRHVDAEVLPLFSRLSNQEQDRIFHPPANGRRRVILATNVAETSLTVPGIRYVVDTGLARINRYDPARKVQGLPIEPISRASADQRSGRCGRVAAGVCIRLYSEESYRSRSLFTDPEIRRSSLASVILRMKSAGLGAIETFPFLDPPDAAAIKDGYETLFELGAIEVAGPEGKLTSIGHAVAKLPVDPRIGRMLLAAEREGCLREATILAAALEVQDPRQRPMGRQEDADRAQQVFRHETSDFLTLLKLWDQYRHATANLPSGVLFDWCREHFVSAARMREWAEMAGQLRRVTDDLGLKEGSESASADAIHRALLTGLITNVACREGDGSFDYRGVRGNVVQIFPGSALFKKGPKWIMAAEVVHTTRLYARTVARIDPAWIEELAGHMFRRQTTDPHLDPDTGEPSGWERVTMSGIVVVPRRRTPIAASDPRTARAVFIREAIAAGKWPPDAAFTAHNRAIREQAASVEGKLRRRDVIRSDDDLAAWFNQHIPPEVNNPESFNRWWRSADPAKLNLSLGDVLTNSARSALQPTVFPDEVEVGGQACRLTYALAPGKDEDGVTLTIELANLPELTLQRAQWLVPGLLPELVQSLFKSLPRAERSSIEKLGQLDDTARACAEVMTFGDGSLADGLSETLSVLHGLRIDPSVWSFKGLPQHLRLRIRVTDHSGKEIAVDRDLAALQERLAGRIRKAREAADRARFDRRGLKSWDFGDLPDPGSHAQPGDDQSTFPALMDEGDAVALTLVPTAREATALTFFGIRRLFTLACREEVGFYLEALPQWHEMIRHFNALGTTAELRDQLTGLIADRTFLDGQSLPRTKQEFEDRSSGNWGRLSAASREVGEAVAKALEARAKVAHRIAGGTPRLWAESVADIREHATYLMPRGFLGFLTWERVKRYPGWAGLMRERLFALREDGSRAETGSLQQFAPHWKKFTGWVAAAMSAERTARESEGQAAPTGGKTGKVKAPLPQARRTGAAVNLEAGEWAMRPGNLPPAVERYRWALEDLRLAIFGPSGSKPPITAADVEKLWTKAAAETSG